jgi:hypothetical protein
LCHASDRETPADDRPFPPDPHGDLGAKLSCAPVPFVVMDDERRSLDEEAITMRYLALLGGDESLQPGPGTPEFDAVLERYWQFHEKNDEAILAGEALQPSITATTVRHRDGQPLVTSGPFAETVEALGGFYVLEAETLDDAIELARQIPAASDGWVAVRPMVEWFDRSAAVEAGDGDPPVPGPPPEGPRFLALIYGRETDGDVPDTPEWDAGAAEHGRFIEAAGSPVRAGGALHLAATTTTVQVRDGEVLVTDGPYAESAEVTGGLYLLQVGSPEDAVAIAARIPAEAVDSVRSWRWNS